MNINKFLEEYELTDNVAHYTVSKEIEMWLKEANITISMTKFSMELKKYCKIKQYKNIESKIKKFNGKCKQSWIGIKQIFESDDDDNNYIDVDTNKEDISLLDM